MLVDRKRTDFVDLLRPESDSDEYEVVAEPWAEGPGHPVRCEHDHLVSTSLPHHHSVDCAVHDAHEITHPNRRDSTLSTSATSQASDQVITESCEEKWQLAARGEVTSLASMTAAAAAAVKQVDYCTGTACCSPLTADCGRQNGADYDDVAESKLHCSTPGKLNESVSVDCSFDREGGKHRNHTTLKGSSSPVDSTTTSTSVRRQPESCGARLALDRACCCEVNVVADCDIACHQQQQADQLRHSTLDTLLQCCRGNRFECTLFCPCHSNRERPTSSPVSGSSTFITPTSASRSSSGPNVSTQDHLPPSSHSSLGRSISNNLVDHHRSLNRTSLLRSQSSSPALTSSNVDSPLAISKHSLIPIELGTQPSVDDVDALHASVTIIKKSIHVIKICDLVCFACTNHRQQLQQQQASNSIIDAGSSSTSR